jgi:hypothetical protein
MARTIQQIAKREIEVLEDEVASGVKIRSIEDLVSVTLRMVEGVVAGTDDNRRAVVHYLGIRTVLGALKIDLEAKKAGFIALGGIAMSAEKIDGNNSKPNIENSSTDKKKK